MTSKPDIHEEGRHRSDGDGAPLSLLIAAASLLVLVAYFVLGDHSAASTVPAIGAPDYQVASDSATAGPSAGSPTSATVTIHPVRDPNRIVIPAIDVDASVGPVGLLENGDMETPDWGEAGWYSLGPAPGEPGPAVILAHMDSVHGRDVFYDLNALQPGDEVFVYGADDDPAVFVVDSVELQLKTELPRDSIWYYSEQPLIRLITCGGQYDRKWGHYLSNFIVYGHLVR